MSTSTTKKSEITPLSRPNEFPCDFKAMGMDNVIKENDMNEKYWHYEFKQLYLKAWNKLDKIIKELD